MKTKFKAIRPIEVKHERGTDLLTGVVGTVIKEENNRVYLKGLMYNYSISKSDFLNYNVMKS